MSDCSQHKKEVAGISDMKVLAEMIGDLHYESLKKLLKEISDKLHEDAYKDRKVGRNRLAFTLGDAATNLNIAAKAISKAWQISKPFMTNDNPQTPTP